MIYKYLCKQKTKEENWFFEQVILANKGKVQLLYTNHGDNTYVTLCEY